jgi:hypothetical protein
MIGGNLHGCIHQFRNGQAIGGNGHAVPLHKDEEFTTTSVTTEKIHVYVHNLDLGPPQKYNEIPASPACIS